MKSLVYEAKDEQATAALGRALAEVLPPGTTVALYGTLGAGKTRLVQAVAEGLGVDRNQVVSPTFVLIQEYQGRRPLFHLDAYRLRDEDEFLELGPDEYFESEGITLVEWADRVVDCLPAEHVNIHVEVTGSHARRFTISATGASCGEVPRRLSERLADTD